MLTTFKDVKKTLTEEELSIILDFAQEAMSYPDIFHSISEKLGYDHDEMCYIFDRLNACKDETFKEKEMEFLVSVEKRMYATGTVKISSTNPDAAIEMVQKFIDDGVLTLEMVEWGEPQYEDASFEITGDVE